MPHKSKQKKKSPKIEQKNQPREYSPLEKISIKATTWIGSTKSLIIHTVFFAGSFMLYFLGANFEKILLVVTTLVSLEAIYLSILIQMTVNRNTEELVEVSRDIEEIQEDVEEISEDIDEIQEDMEEISEDVEEIQKDVDEIQEDVEEIEKDVDEIQEDVEVLEHDLVREEKGSYDEETIKRIEKTLELLIKELREQKKPEKKK